MVSRIGPLVQAGASRNLLALHIAGGVLGGAAIGLALGTVGSLLNASTAGVISTHAQWAISTLLLSLAIVDLVRVRLPLEVHRQTPSWWPCALGAEGGCLAWGFDLSLLLTTRIPSTTAFILPFFCVIGGNVSSSIVVMTLYGFARTTVVAMAVLSSSQRELPEVCHVLGSRDPSTRQIVSVLALAHQRAACDS